MMTAALLPARPLTIRQRLTPTLLVAPTAALQTPGSAAPAHAADAPYLVGSGRYDITGEAAETGMFGYANGRDATGIQQRRWPHAHIIASPTSGQRIVFVSADMGAMFTSVSQGAVSELQRRHGSLYGYDNVMLTATHTHVGNAGQAHDPLFILASADSSLTGWSRDNYDPAVHGIVQAIEQAHNNLSPGNVTLQTTQLTTAAKKLETRRNDRSVTTVEWRIGDDDEPGSHRLVQVGEWKNGWTGRISSYRGESRSFVVR